jgi:hypothetical protein
VKLIYKPVDGKERIWEDVIPNELMSFQTDWLEAAGGDMWESFEEWARLLWVGNRKARRALLYVMLRTENPSLRWPSLVVRNDELDVHWEMADLDVAGTRKSIEDDPELTPERRAEMLADLEAAQESIDPKGDAGNAPEQEASVDKDADTVST